MRIIGGAIAGLRVNLPAKMPRTRPTTDRAREALFNILDNRLQWGETAVLDLFAGTGMLSYECLSRGAKSVCLVEKDAPMLGFIKNQLRLLGFTNTKIWGADTLKLLAKPALENFQLILADPPYSFANYELLHHLIFTNGFMANKALCVIEHRSNLQLTHLSGHFMCRRYGDSSFSFFQYS